MCFLGNTVMVGKSLKPSLLAPTDDRWIPHHYKGSAIFSLKAQSTEKKGAYGLGSGVREHSLPSLRHIIQVHDHSGNALIAQLRVPPVLQPVRVRLCNRSM